MIDVVLKIKNKKIIGYEVSGHALFAEAGKDIVCAAVTILSFNVVDTMTDVLKLSEKMNYEIKENSLSLNIEPRLLTSDELHDTQVVLRGFEIGVRSLLQNYSDYISLYYREV